MLYSMRKKDIGRILRSFPPTARVLTEIRVRQLLASPAAADLGQCVRHAKPGSTVVDVGASVGNYSLALRKAVGPKGCVLALEANPAVYKELVCSTWMAGIDTRNVAVSSSAGMAELLIPLDEQGRVEEPIATLEARTRVGRRIQVQRVKLDDLLQSAERVTLIKIDVEGHEFDVILGATLTIDRHRPTLMIEIEQQHQSGTRQVGDVVRLLTDRGYACFGIHGTELIPWEQFSIDRWQTSWLAADESYRSSHLADYVNNFLFVDQSSAR